MITGLGKYKTFLSEAVMQWWSDEVLSVKYAEFKQSRFTGLCILVITL